MENGHHPGQECTLSKYTESLHSIPVKLRASILHEAILKMTPTQSQYLMEHMQGKAIWQIAADHGVYKSTVSRTIKRARAKLTEILESTYIVRVEVDE